MDYINGNVPVSQPDAEGCYRWLSIKAGQPSIFCSPTGSPAATLAGDLDLNGRLITNNNLPETDPLFHGSGVSFRRDPANISMTIPGTGNVLDTASYIDAYLLAGVYHYSAFFFVSDAASVGNTIQFTLNPEFPSPPIDESDTATLVQISFFPAPILNTTSRWDNGLLTITVFLAAPFVTSGLILVKLVGSVPRA